MNDNDVYEDYKNEIKEICLKCSIGVVNCPHYSSFKGNPTNCKIIRDKLKLF